MPAFEYRSLDHRGKINKGTLEADSARQVRQQLRDKGWVPLEVNEASDTNSQGMGRFAGSGKINGAEQALITRQLATLLKSGLPVEQALSAVSKQAANDRIERIMLAVRAKVREGYSLARSFESFPRAFPEMYRATVAAGEQSGHLEQVLEQLADYLETRHDTGRSVAQAMIYPAFIMVFASIVIMLMMTFVVPKLVAVFEGRDQALPLLTRIVMAMSDFARGWGWLVVLLIVVGVVIFMRAMRDPRFRLRVHQRLVNMPLVGTMLRAGDSARLASTLGILGRSGVPLVDALFIAAQVVGNLAVRNAVKNAAAKVREGGSLSRALDASGYFPPMLVQMIASGEASGELDNMLTRAADYQERELSSTINTMVGLLGPIMLLVMAGVVVMIVLSVMLPIMQMNNLLAG
ncbi:MAG: type II secretion system inner membrane protein GspF [Alcanivorax sp.]|uniref:type II secretion system inner membrane protein GspF n=2 Tax=Alcanivorax TaxID=59753 RepID=UPI0007B8435E|nr:MULTISPECIES: type II secretion system inner membrane protein GspF [unclassified Alcanivorax]KZY31502.1 type II secretion system protein GspF [Alcanivorax sp. HI0044]PHR68007.1 MAG: type II secretion system protein GspF [Alcanivorax sp.]